MMSDIENARYTSSMRTSLIVSYVLTIVGFGLIGVIIAYLRRGDARGSMWETHTTYIIRTFWLSLLFIVVGVITTFIWIGVLILFAVGIWGLVRTIKGLLKAINYEPVMDPETWGF